MITAGQIYRSTGQHATAASAVRILVKWIIPYDSGLYDAGTARIVTLTGRGREARPRAIKLDQLHDSPLTRDGQLRRTGYVLEVQP